MNLMEAIAIFVTGVFASTMTHRVMVKTPFWQAMVDVIFIGIDPCSWGNKGLDERTDRRLLDILQPPNYHRPATLNPPENRRFFFLQGPPPPCPLQPTPTPSAAFFFTASGCPL